MKTLIASNDDLYSDDDMESSLSSILKTPYISVQKLLDIPAEKENFFKIVHENFTKMTYENLQKEFNHCPSLFRMRGIRLNKCVQILKKYGKVFLVNSDYLEGGIALNFIIKFISHQDNNSFMFMHFGEFGSLDSSYYEEFKSECYLETSEIVYSNSIKVYASPGDELCFDLINKIKDEASFKFSKSETYIEMISATMHGLTTQKIKFDINYNENDLDLHYGEGFSIFHGKLIERIKKKDKGIIMLHGPPGHGKTHYIRRLLPAIMNSGKRILLIPKNVLSSLESPAFNQFMLENFSNSQKIVFIIEDSESIIAQRTQDGGGRSETVSTLLNITDGLLNDIFKVQVILTFNTSLSSIDQALLRKGRLLAKYSFDKLSKADAIKLAEYLKIELKEDKSEYSLAEIYAARETDDDEILINQNIVKAKAEIGF